MIRPADLSPPRPPVALTPAMARAFALVAEAGASGYRVPPGRDAAAINAALWACNGVGLVMPAGRGWKLTPLGEARRADMQAAGVIRGGKAETPDA